jgi:regulatory protein
LNLQAKRILTYDQAAKKAESYCVYQERSQQETRDKLYSWGMHRRDVELIISQLISDGFLKEERFAVAFAGGKFRIKKWGRVKIKMALKEKKVSEPLIRQALKSIDDNDYRKTLEAVLKSKSKSVKEKNPLKKNYKVASYAISRGFEAELVWQLLKMNNEE